MTELDILRSRFEEARAIKDAWEHRLNRAHEAHAEAVQAGSGTDITQPIITAVEIHFADATTHHRVALDAWAAASTTKEAQS